MTVAREAVCSASFYALICRCYDAASGFTAKNKADTYERIVCIMTVLNEYGL